MDTFPHFLKRFCWALCLIMGICIGGEVFYKPAFCMPLIYTVENVESDVTDESAVKAREKALMEGQRKALHLLLKRLTGTSTAWEAAFNSLKDSDISNLVEDFEITQEKSSSVRYIVTLTYRFKKYAIHEFLSRFGIVPQEIETPENPLLVIPVLKVGTKYYLWEDDNLWRTLWQEESLSSSNIPLRIPLGDLEDIQILDAPQATNLNLRALGQIADRYKAAGGAIVVVADLTPDPLSPIEKEGIPLNSDSVEVNILDPSLSPQETKLPILQDPKGADPALKTTRHLLNKALRATLKFLNSNTNQITPRKSLVSQEAAFTTSFSSKTEWFRIRQTLDALKNKQTIEDFSLQSLTPQTASLAIKFRGDLISLKQALQAQNLNFIQKEMGAEKNINQHDSSLPLKGDLTLNAPF